jgi:ADP-heptose:LPS heptosyltransferase
MIKHYFWGHYGWQYIKSVKDQYPETKIKLLTTCCNPIGNELFKFHPCIDEIEAHPWQDPNREWKNIGEYTKGYKDLDRAPDYLSNITLLKPDTIHLGGNDKQEVAKYKPSKEYIIMHPFAGDAIRAHMSLKDYFVLARQLINTLHCEIIIVGGTSQRVIGKTSRRIEESFPHKQAGIVNLVDKISIRSAIRLTQSASFFIGTNSCFFCVRFALGQPRIIYSKRTNIPQATKKVRICLEHTNEQ